VELWHAGAALRLAMSADGMGQTTYVLGPDMTLGTGTEAAGVQAAGTQATGVQAVVPMGCWQAAESLGAWSLVSCVVAQAFRFNGFELALPGWQPNG